MTAPFTITGCSHGIVWFTANGVEHELEFTNVCDPAPNERYTYLVPEVDLDELHDLDPDIDQDAFMRELSKWGERVSGNSHYIGA